MVTIDNSLNGIAKIAQHVPAVGDLHSVWRTLSDTVGVGPGTVARDNLDARVLTEPVGQRCCLPIGQQIHDPIALQIDQNGSIPMATTPSPVIDRNYARRHRRAHARPGRSHHSQQGIGADRHGNPLCETSSSFPAKSQTQVPLQIAKPLGSAAPCHCIVEPLGEGLAHTSDVKASKPPRR
jgi:hypothetical protein